jgi:acyl homoserine lactone synthase
MALNIQINKRKYFKSEDLWAMHKLRARVFKGRMGWEIPILSGMEIDGYDAIEPIYMLIKSNAGVLLGCWRVLPTDGPYMLKDSFPELLHGQPAPESKKIWELSRFAIETDSNDGFGFSNLTIESIREMMAYGKKHGVKQYVTVTTTAIERLLRRAGAVTSRLGPPLVIGVENAVALYLDVSETYDALSIALPAAA